MLLCVQYVALYLIIFHTLSHYAFRCGLMMTKIVKKQTLIVALQTASSVEIFTRDVLLYIDIFFYSKFLLSLGRQFNENICFQDPPVVSN